MIVLHIGTDKTGSTAIQKMLQWNREYFKELGWLYPESSKMNHNHACLKIALENSDNNFFNILQKEIDDFSGDHVIFSFEGLYHLNSSQLIILRDYLVSLNKGEIKVILYLRRQDEKLESGILQRIKQNSHIHSLGQYEEIPYNKNLDYNAIVKKWENTFGHEAMHIKPYGKKFFTNKNTLYSEFIDATLGVSMDSLESLVIPQRDQNPSLDAVSAYVLSYLKKLGITDSFYDDIVSQLLHIQSIEGTSKSKLFSYEQRVKFLNQYEKSNAELGDRITTSLFELPKDLIDSKVVNENEVIDRLGKLYSKSNLLLGTDIWNGKIGFVNSVNKNKIVLLDGFYRLKEWGAWTKGSGTSRLGFRISRKIVRSNTIEILLDFTVKYLGSSDSKSFVRIKGDEDTDWIELTSKTELRINRNEIEKNNGVIILEIYHENPKSQYELNINDDKRVLGCGIRNLGFQEIV